MKKHILTAIACGLVFTIAACSGSSTDTGDTLMTDSPMMGMTTDTMMYEMAQADLSGTKSDTVVIGTAKFMRKGDKVELTLNLDIPKKANSSVAVHFHEHGDCGDSGKASHGHWNPTNEDHGKWGSAAYHSGDIGNIDLDKDGKATFTAESDRWTIGGPAITNVLNLAIIIHSGVDDYTSQPTGNSGSRIGCGVVNKL